ANAWVEAHRAHVGPLVDVLGDGQPQPPQADVVGDGRPAHGAEVGGAETLQHLQGVLVHHPAGLLVVPTAPREFGPREGEGAVRTSGDGVEDGTAGGDDLNANAVGGDGGDLVGTGGGRVGHHVSCAVRDGLDATVRRARRRSQRPRATEQATAARGGGGCPPRLTALPCRYGRTATATAGGR